MAQELGLLLGHVRAIGREQDDAAGGERIERMADRGRRGRRLRRAGKLKRGEKLRLTGKTFRGRIGGAVESDNIAARVDQGRRRFPTRGMSASMVTRWAPVMRSRATCATTPGGTCRTISPSTMRFEDGMIKPMRVGHAALPEVSTLPV